MKKVGIVGLGNIGSALLKIIREESRFEYVGYYDTEPKDNSVLELNELIDYSDLIIECAHPSIVTTLLNKVISAEIDILVMSVGGLIDYDLDKVERSNTRVYIPSGAIAGVDAIKAAAEGSIREIELTMTKPPLSLGVDQTRREIIFEGSAADAMERFPKNVNVAVTLKLASKHNPSVKIISDPTGSSLRHTIKVKGDFGEIETAVENVPSAQNPKTSYLAILSAIATLRRIASNVQIGN